MQYSTKDSDRAKQEESLLSLHSFSKHMEIIVGPETISIIPIVLGEAAHQPCAPLQSTESIGMQIRTPSIGICVAGVLTISNIIN